MSKWLEELRESNNKRIKARIEKLDKEVEEYRLNYRDFPYDRYLKAMNSRLEEINELTLALSPEDAKREIEDWQDRVHELENTLGRVNVLAVNIEPSDKKSDTNVKRLMALSGGYACTDEMFKAEVERGVW